MTIVADFSIGSDELTRQLRLEWHEVRGEESVILAFEHGDSGKVRLMILPLFLALNSQLIVNGDGSNEVYARQ